MKAGKKGLKKKAMRMKEKAEVQEFATSCMSCGVIRDMRALWTSASNGP